MLTNGDKEFVYGCVPNGKIGISVILNGTAQIKTDNGWEMQPAISIYGLIKKVQFHKMSPHYHEINIGFDPHYLQFLLKDSLSNLKERSATDLSLILDKNELAKLVDYLNQSYDDEQLLSTIDTFLQHNLHQLKIDERILAAYDFICKKYIWKVDHLCSLLKISTTGLRNIFNEQVGISPKDLIKIHRIKKALNVKEHNEESLTSLAYNLQYFDQSHFIHDFKDAIGLTPKQYYFNQKLTFDFYNFQRLSYDSFAV